MSSRRFIVPALLILLAGILRTIAIGNQELWLDEALSWHMARSSGALDVILPSNTPPLYYFVLRGWIDVLGDSRAMLRLLSAVEGTVFVAAVMWWARTLFTRRVALWAGLWAAVAPMAIYYSQETRAYAQLTLLLALMYGCISKALRDERLAWWGAATIAAVAAIHTHYMTPLCLAFSAGLIAAQPSPAAWRRARVCAGILILTSVPWMMAAWWTEHTDVPDGLEWIATIWARTPPSLALFKSLEVLTLGGDSEVLPTRFKQLSGLALPPSLRLLGLTGLLVLAVVAVSRFGESAVAGMRRRQWATSLLTLGPLLVLWSLSWLRPLYVVGRYDQIVMPGFPIILGLACAKLQARLGTALTGAVALLLLVPIGWRLWLYYDAPAPDREARAAAVLDSQTTNGDVVLFTELRAMPVIYELSRRGFGFSGERCTDGDRELVCRTYPRDPLGRFGVQMTPAEPSVATATDIAAGRLSERNAVWLVLGAYRSSKGTLAASRSSAALMTRLIEIGMEKRSADIAAGILELRSSHR